MNDRNGSTSSDDIAASTLGAVERQPSIKPRQLTITPPLTISSWGYDIDAVMNFSTFNVLLDIVVPNNQQTKR
jgi:hypothetical protein